LNVDWGIIVQKTKGLIVGADLDVSSIDVGDNRDFKILTINNKPAKQSVCACDEKLATNRPSSCKNLLAVTFQKVNLLIFFVKIANLGSKNLQYRQ